MALTCSVRAHELGGFGLHSLLAAQMQSCSPRLQGLLQNVDLSLAAGMRSAKYSTVWVRFLSRDAKSSLIAKSSFSTPKRSMVNSECITGTDRNMTNAKRKRVECNDRASNHKDTRRTSLTDIDLGINHLFPQSKTTNKRPDVAELSDALGVNMSTGRHQLSSQRKVPNIKT